MVGRDGRVRVMDLGLARGSGDDATAGPRDVDAPDAAPALALPLTRVGAVMGTPAYMSPEQFCGHPVDARADVFSFCVTLWEALMGERPFAGATAREIEDNVLAGRVRPVPRDPQARRVPGWLRRVCLRGLEVEPARRFVAMSALLDALTHGRTRARARVWLAGGVAAALVAAAVPLLERHERARRSAACDDSGAQIADLWHDEARDAVRAGLVASGVPYAASTADRVLPFLDAQAAAWREHRTRACRMADLDGTLDADHLSRAAWCLDERRMEFGALITELSRADETSARTAVPAAAGLTPVSPCTDRQALAALPTPPPAAARARADAARMTLSRARSMTAAGRYAEGLQRARAALAEARALAWPPMIAAALELEGDLLDRTGAHADAEAASTAAYMEAARARAWDVAASAALDLAYGVGYRQARRAEGELWARHAEIAIAFAGDPLGLHEARRLNVLGRLRSEAGAYAEARGLLERGLSIVEAALGADHPTVTGPLTNIADVDHAMGAYAEAKAIYERSLAIQEKALGPDHPDLADGLANLGSIETSRGAYPEALALHERALALRERALGPESLEVAYSLNSLANLREAMGEHAEALRSLERALVIEEVALGPDHPDLAMVLHNLGNVHASIGANAEARPLFERAIAIEEKALGPDHPDLARTLGALSGVREAEGAGDEARALLERARAIFERSLGPDHPELAVVLGNLGLLHRDRGELAAALVHLERARVILEKALGPDHPQVAQTLGMLASVALELRPAEALPQLERAVAVFDAHAGVQPGELETRFSLARALVVTRGDRTRALAEARAVLAHLREAGDGMAGPIAEVEAFLARHATERPR